MKFYSKKQNYYYGGWYRGLGFGKWLWIWLSNYKQNSIVKRSWQLQIYSCIGFNKIFPKL